MPPSRRMTAGRVAEERPAARLGRPVREFLETEIAGGIFLLAAILIALVWANSPWSDAYEILWHTRLRIALGGQALDLDLQHWVNDGLMVIFFFVVGLEIKRELAVGELSSLRSAALPAVAAFGGMAVPAAVYLAINPSGDAARGWGVPMATDIALALGALALIGRGLPSQLRILLLSLAIVDDIGAILVIALFYSGGVELLPLGIAAGLLGVVLALRRLRLWWVPLYVVVGAGVWLAVLTSGVHATIAGVALGLLTPARPLREGEERRIDLPGEQDERHVHGVEEAGMARMQLSTSVPVTERLAHALHPWTSYLILPVFALANAGVAFDPTELAPGLARPLGLGIVAGLVVGKTVGISGAAWFATRLGARLPTGITWRHVIGMSALAGIGFTMSLFISSLAFPADLVEEAKLGILAGSLLAAIVGALVLRSARHEDGS